ncbi:hypothetical protein BC833DRAFT_591693 [Globomyces pollinis-pini]|nr:hypothetical protein BC833DRAFT_591693 [Globomyces pollinis-pini]
MIQRIKTCLEQSTTKSITVDRISKCLIPTIKQSESDHTRTASHDLLIRGGFIRQSHAGLYTFLPLGMRVLTKLESIIDREMRNVDGQKVSMPCLLSSENWKKTGRWSGGNEMFKLKDRKNGEYLLAPTHEEEVTSLASSLVSSFRQLPLRIYQIGKKYRDELRPRSGLLRAKEFIMKDMYSFDKTEEEALKTYDEVSGAYRSIMKQLSIPYAVAEADTGNIGGTRSHEYHVISPVGEDTILSCANCGYDANVEKAVGKMVEAKRGELKLPFPLDKVPAIREMKVFSQSYGSVYSDCDAQKYYLIIVPEGRSINSIKLEKIVNIEGPLVLVEGSTIDASKLQSITVYMDSNIAFDSASITQVHDLIETTDGDTCIKCNDSKSSVLETKRAIEVGHTFYLGTRYSKPLEATFKNSNQKLVEFEMGCYGIGVSRLISAVIEASHDSKGIIWPQSISPYSICIIPIFSRCDRSYNSDIVQLGLNTIDLVDPTLLNAGEVIVDDRDAGVGFKLKDAALIGYPLVFVLGNDFMEKGIIEIHVRRTGEVLYVSEIGELKNILDNLK